MESLFKQILKYKQKYYSFARHGNRVLEWKVEIKNCCGVKKEPTRE
jgi:hypothetical protein